MSGMRAQKAKKAQATAAARSSRSRKGHNKVAKPSRTDKKKGASGRRAKNTP